MSAQGDRRLAHVAELLRWNAEQAELVGENLLADDLCGVRLSLLGVLTAHGLMTADDFDEVAKL
jgi:hypothetical protein